MFHSNGLGEGSTFVLEIPIFKRIRAESDEGNYVVEFSSHSQRSFALPLRGHGHATIKPEFGLLLREAFPPPPTKPTGTADSAIKQNDSNFEVDLESASAVPAALCVLIVDDSSANRYVFEHCNSG